ncbi:MAG: ACP S-malonyltransferase, partial [Rhodanobacteraceae bacterium]
AGHSLGEYAALVAAGALEFETGLRLTRRRGELMASVSARTPGAMAAVLGLPSDQVVDICRDTPGLVEIANYNSPNQTVISGEEQPVLRASQLAREQGARRVIPLQVSAPFHCSLMEPLREQFAPNVDCADLRDPQIPVIANATGLPETDVRTVRRNLLEQLASPVRWTDSMRWLLDNGFETFIEIGPGKVLSGLMRSIAPGTTVHTAQNADSLDELLAAVPCR